MTLAALAHPSVAVRRLHDHEVSNGEGGRDLVTVVVPVDDDGPETLARYLAGRRKALDQALAEEGAVLFRGFRLDTATFEQIMGEVYETGRFLWMLPMPPSWGQWLLNLPLIGPRTRRFLGWVEELSTGRRLRRQDVSTLANDDTLQFPHHEYGIFFNVPRVIAFWCERASDEDGETILCDGEAALRDLEPAVRQRFESARGIRYRDKNQPLMPPFIAPALLPHPSTGRHTANFTAYHHDVAAEVAEEMFPTARVAAAETDDTFLFEPRMIDAHGKRHDISREEVGAIARAHFEHAVLLRWHKDDLLLLDNFKLLHGRLNAGSPKKLLHIILGDHVANRVRFSW